MTTAPAATSSSNRSASLSADDVRRTDRNLANGDQDAIASRDSSFALLVESLHVSESMSVTDIATNLTSEVFDASGQSTIEKQRAESDANYRDQALSGLDNARFDRTGVQARSDTATQAAAHQSANAKIGTTGSFITTESFGSTSEHTLVPSGENGPDDATTRMNSTSLRAALSATNASANDTPKHENIDLAVNQNAATISTTASSVVGGVITTADRTTVSPAQQVGQLLSLERSGESAGVRTSSAPVAVTSGDTGQANSNRAQDAGGSRVSAKDDDSFSTNKTGEPAPTDFSKLVRSLRMQVGEHHSSARLHLRPPELGRVVVDVRMDGDAIQIDVQAETEEGRQLLTERAAQLRFALEDAGVVLDRLNVMMAVQPETVSSADHNRVVPRNGHILTDPADTSSENLEAWQEQPEELLAATLKATRKRLGFSDRARLDVRA